MGGGGAFEVGRLEPLELPDLLGGGASPVVVERIAPIEPIEKPDFGEVGTRARRGSNKKPPKCAPWGLRLVN